jgi:hypothetical protein
MRRLLLIRWRGQFDRPAIVRLIRRKIRGTILSERTVLVDAEGTGITQEQAAAIMQGWDAQTVKFCGCVHTLPHPLPEGVVIPAAKPRPRRSNPPAYRPQTGGDGQIPQRGHFVRVSVFWLPNTLWEDLPALALLSTPSGTLEGWLLEDILVGGRISLDVRYWHGQLTLGWFGSPIIARISGEWILTEKYLYRAFRVPPLGHNSLGDIP